MPPQGERGAGGATGGRVRIRGRIMRALAAGERQATRGHPWPQERMVVCHDSMYASKYSQCNKACNQAGTNPELVPTRSWYRSQGSLTSIS